MSTLKLTMIVAVVAALDLAAPFAAKAADEGGDRGKNRLPGGFRCGIFGAAHGAPARGADAIPLQRR